jgi:hypothetical protein
MSKKKEKDPSNDGMKETKMPSIFKMAANFAKDLTKYIAEGAPNVSHKVYTERLNACTKCPHLIKKSMRCGKCGCALEHKAKWRTTTCPDIPSRWDPLYLSPDDLIKIETAKNLIEDEEVKKIQERDKKYLKKVKKWNKTIQKAYEDGTWHPTKNIDMEKATFEADSETFIPDDRQEKESEPGRTGKGENDKSGKGVQKGLQDSASETKDL